VDVFLSTNVSKVLTCPSKDDTDVTPFLLTEIGDQAITCLIKYGWIKAICPAYYLTYAQHKLMLFERWNERTHTWHHMPLAQIQATAFHDDVAF